MNENKPVPQSGDRQKTLAAREAENGSLRGLGSHPQCRELDAITL
jgi:hypothetical protein